VLYEVALLIGWLNDRRKKNRTEVYAALPDDEASPLDFDDSGETARRAALEAKAAQDDRAGRRARAELARLAAQAQPEFEPAGADPNDIT
jgi:sec-independent protein translocase protein TatC